MWRRGEESEFGVASASRGLQILIVAWREKSASDGLYSPPISTAKKGVGELGELRGTPSNFLLNWTAAFLFLLVQDDLSRSSASSREGGHKTTEMRFFFFLTQIISSNWISAEPPRLFKLAWKENKFHWKFVTFFPTPPMLKEGCEICGEMLWHPLTKNEMCIGKRTGCVHSVWKSKNSLISLIF